MDSDADIISRLLVDLREGRSGAEGELLRRVYDRLRRMARTRMSALPAGDSLQSAGLVHEAWLRVRRGDGPEIESRRHFFFAAARAMHDVLVEEARRKATLKRGGGHRRVEADLALPAPEFPPEDLLAVADAVRSLDEDDRRLVELRFFAGLTMAETAEVLEVPLRSLERDWQLVKARLFRMLGPDRT